MYPPRSPCRPWAQEHPEQHCRSQERLDELEGPFLIRFYEDRLQQGQKKPSCPKLGLLGLLERLDGAAMNVSLLDPFQNDFPEVIEEYLEHGIAKCIAFNRRGTLLAAGCSDGSVVIWDFHTRGVATELRDPNCTKAIANVSWSKCGYHLLAASTDKTISCWDVARGVKIGTETLPHTALHAHMHPGRPRSKVCLACPVSHAPFLVNFESGEKHLLPMSTTSKTKEAGEQTGRGKASDTVGYSLSAACFNKAGDLIFLGNTAGEILIIDTETREIRRSVQVQGGAAIRQIAFSRSGSFLLTVSSDRVIRVFENLFKDNATAALSEPECESETKPSSVFNVVKEFQDSVNRPHWKTASFSNDSEYVVGASASKSDHKIYIWSREFGQLKKMLEGPKEGIMDLAWHPNRPLLASLAMSGVIYIWAKDYTENWSAFAPDFRELEENEEYVEREDEFDLNAETEKVKPSQVEEDADVDITTTEKIAVFSDSDSEDNLHYLPSVPEPDPEEPPPKAEQTSQPSESNDSPVSEETNPPESVAAVPQPPSPPQEEEVGANGRAKRKRKLSEKAAELQAELGRKSKKTPKGKGTKGDEDDSEETLEDLPATKKQTRRQQKLKPVSSLPSENQETPTQS